MLDGFDGAEAAVDVSEVETKTDLLDRDDDLVRDGWTLRRDWLALELETNFDGGGLEEGCFG